MPPRAPPLNLLSIFAGNDPREPHQRRVAEPSPPPRSCVAAEFPQPRLSSIRWGEHFLTRVRCFFSRFRARRSRDLARVLNASAAETPFTVREATGHHIAIPPPGLAAPELRLAYRIDSGHRQTPQHPLHRRLPPRRRVSAPLRCQGSTASTRRFRPARHTPDVAPVLVLHVRPFFDRSAGGEPAALTAESAPARAARWIAMLWSARRGLRSWAGPASAVWTWA
jgi:hypothetical protein